MEKEHFIITGKLTLMLRGESPRERLLHRLHAVVLVLSGKSALEIGKAFKDSPRAVSYWVTRFKAKGIAGLEEEGRPGRPSKLSDSQMKQVQAFVRKMNAKSQPLNSEALASYLLNQFAVSLTPRHRGVRVLRSNTKSLQVSPLVRVRHVRQDHISESRRAGAELRMLPEYGNRKLASCATLESFRSKRGGSS